MKKLFIIAIAVSTLSSCVTVNYANKEAVSMPSLRVKRSDYKLTSDISTEVEITAIFWGLKNEGIEKSKVKIGEINGDYKNSTPDEKLAIYNLIQKYPNVDYLTNIRYIKTYDNTFFGFKKVYKTKIIAKGIILITDK